MIYVLAEMDTDGTMSPYVKIGFVTGGRGTFMARIKNRVNKLQVGNPRQLVVVGMFDGERIQEKEIHYRFHSDRVRRPAVTEWMRVQCGSELAAWLESVRVEPMTFGVDVLVSCASCGKRHRKGVGCRTYTSKCGLCKAVGHNRQNCPTGPARLRLVASRSEGRHSRGDWTWRGKRRGSRSGERRRSVLPSPT